MRTEPWSGIFLVAILMGLVPTAANPIASLGLPLANLPFSNGKKVPEMEGTSSASWYGRSITCEGQLRVRAGFAFWWCLPRDVDRCI